MRNAIRHGLGKSPSVLLPLLVVLLGMAGAAAQENLRLESTLNSDEYAAGEPVFVTLKIANTGESEQSLLIGPRGIADGDWSLEVAREGRELERVRVSRRNEYFLHGRPPHRLAPGDSLTDHVALWFRAYKGPLQKQLPKPRKLVFPEPGRYRYRIEVLVWPSEREGSFWLRTEGVVVIGEAKEGFPVVRDKLGVITESRHGLTGVDWTNARQLEELGDELRGTRYARYAKWLRVRASVEASRGGWEAIEHGGQAALHEFQVLRDYSMDLLAEFGGTALPPERAALVALAVIHAAHSGIMRKVARGSIAELQEYDWVGVLNKQELPAMGYPGDVASLSPEKAQELAESEHEAGMHILRDMEKRFPPSPEIQYARERLD